MQTTSGERLIILDVLRGFALFGMLAVHLYDQFGPASESRGRISAFIELFVESKAATTFAILFGVGFALQIREAQARGEAYAPKLLRRSLGLAIFGIFAELVFGYNVLFGYAKWSLLLLLVWPWRKRALLAMFLICAASQSLYYIATGSYQWATLGVEATRAENRKLGESDRAARQERKKGEASESFRTVVAARMAFFPWFHTRPFSFTPWLDFTYFLVGLLALRMRVFEQPGEHRRLILGVMGFGVLSWAVAHWVLPLPWPVFEIQRVSRPIQDLLRIIRDEWLALTYIGTILLAYVWRPEFISSLTWFVWTGRMALTNYMIHIALIDIVGRPYGFGLSVHSELAPLAAFALFPVLALFSRWWLLRFRFGPAEWALRSITYWKWQPMRFDTSDASA